jgi:hypothetical protein
VQVVRLGGKKRAAITPLQMARRPSGSLQYGQRIARGDAFEFVDPQEEEERTQLSVACVFFTPRKWVYTYLVLAAKGILVTMAE